MRAARSSPKTPEGCRAAIGALCLYKTHPKAAADPGPQVMNQRRKEQCFGPMFVSLQHKGHRYYLQNALPAAMFGSCGQRFMQRHGSIAGDIALRQQNML